MKLVHAALAVLLVASTADAAIPLGEAARRVEPALLAVEAPSILSIVVRCEDCTEQAPTIGLLWNVADPGHPEQRRILSARNWDAGLFVLSGTTDLVIQGEPVQGGWTVRVRLPDAGLPFRVTGGLPGFVADKAVYWPAQAPGVPVVFDMKRLDAVLDANPTWDPARTAECEILVPKSAELPVVMTSGDQPRAWLFPSVGTSDDEASWTFQFVRPGASLMERVSVSVTAFDEGSSWAFRLPLEGALPAPVAPPLSGDATPDQLALAKAREIAGTPRLVIVAGTGIFDLADCPRIVR